MAGVLHRTVEEEMHQWRELFEGVLNHEERQYLPEVEPCDELNIRTGHITHAEFKNPIKKLRRQHDVTIYHQRQLRLGMNCQRRFLWTSVTRYGVKSRCQRDGRNVC